MVVVVGPAVRLIVCWPKAAAAAKGRIASTRAAFFKIALKFFVCIVFSLLSTVASTALHAFVNHKFPRIHQHHHEHSTWENVVRRNLTLVVGVPHKGPAALVGRVELEVGRVQRGAARIRGVAGGDTVGIAYTGWHRSAQGSVRTQVRGAAVPGAVGKDSGIGQSGRAACRHIAEWVHLYGLVVVLAPLHKVNRPGRARVITV